MRRYRTNPILLVAAFVLLVLFQAQVPAQTQAFVVPLLLQQTTPYCRTSTQLHPQQPQRPQPQPTSPLLLRGLPFRVDVDDVDDVDKEQPPKPLPNQPLEPLQQQQQQQQHDDTETYRMIICNTILSIVASVAFGVGLWFTIGPQVGQEFFAGYIVEKSLSVDNLFVFLLLFEYFRVLRAYQGQVLSWGIYGSIIMQTTMISLGAAALHKFWGILLIFAAILIFSAAQVLVDKEEKEIMGGQEDLSNNPIRFLCQSNDKCDIDAFVDNHNNNGSGGGESHGGNQNPLLTLSQSLIPSTNTYDGDRFFTVQDGIRKATPLFVCMVAIELSDVVFAVDSIPTVFGVTENPLVVFSSNMFAILGLRSFFPVLSKAATDLKYLEPVVAVIFACIGAKMVAEYFGYTIPTELALAIFVSLLSVGIGASLWEKQRRQSTSPPPPPPPAQPQQYLLQSEDESENKNENENATAKDAGDD